jgi:ABC-type antimicrobial peptide transport system permease subunit
MLALKSQVAAQGGGNRRAYLRKALIIGQFTVSQAFIIGTLVVSRQIDFMLQKDLGFKKDEVVIVNLPRFWDDSLARRRKFTLIDELKRLPGVQSVSLTGNVIASSNTNTTLFNFQRGQAIEPINPHRRGVDAEFIPLFGLKLLAGRNLVTSDTMQELVINETLSRQLGFATPQAALGHELIAYNKSRKPIVGVVQDFHIQPLRQALAPTYLASEREYADILNLKLQTKGRPAEQVQATLDKIKEMYQNTYADAEELFNYSWLDEQVSQFYREEERVAKLMGLATGLAVFISCLGLFGLTSYLINQRVKEISIRKVLGATVLQVSTLLSKDFVKLVALAFAVATPVAYYLAQKWLADFAYQAPLGWDLFALAGGGALGLAVLTVSYRAIRAALANPVDSLRNE